MPLRALGACLQCLGRRSGEKVLCKAVEMTLPFSIRGGEFIGVPGHACRRELVDEREHQFGEPGDHQRWQAPVDGGCRELAPGHPRPDPIGR